MSKGIDQETFYSLSKREQENAFFVTLEEILPLLQKLDFARHAVVGNPTAYNICITAYTLRVGGVSLTFKK